MSGSDIRIDFKSYIPYYIQLKQGLEEKIDKGELTPGEQLPSEPVMCELYGVSRTVVRQALRELDFEGLITREKGKGTFVTKRKIEESLVQKLTGFYQDMVERGHTITTQVLHDQVEPADPDVAQKLQLEPGVPVYNIERLRFIDGEPIVLVTTYIPHGLCPRLSDFDLTDQSLYAILEKDFHLIISHGRRTIEAVPANEREARLLRVAEHEPMILLHSVTYLKDGAPMEYYHAVHRGDRSRFEVNLVKVDDSADQPELFRAKRTGR